MTRGRGRQHVPLRAILLIVSAVLCFAVLDAAVKLLTQRYSIPFLVWARYSVQAVAMLLWLAPTMRWGLLKSRNMPLQTVRGALLVMSSLSFVSGLKYLPLAEAIALNYTTPVLVTILAVAFLGERMTPQRVGFVVAALIGMLLIVRPGSGVFGAASLFALGSAGFYAVYQILTRILAGDDARVSLFYPAFMGTLLLTAGLPWFDLPTTVPWSDGAMIVGTGLLGTLGHFMFIRAFQLGPASALTPFSYMQLVWATMVGWLAFGTFPDGYALAGMLVITASGLLIAWHERRQAQAGVVELTAVD
jgi:drug/metabolite transporter (DMT)-like permease